MIAILFWALPFVRAEEYTSGRDLYAVTRHLFVEERGSFIRVPMDYAHPSDRTTPLYFATPFGFDAAKPTIVYFEGGPGYPCHGDLAWLRPVKDSHNLVVFDQRGMGFSRPDQSALHEDPKFYSSENTARDADLIRRHLGIARWTVMGASYGTVPATMYGSLFSENTRALILMGTVFSHATRAASFDNMLAWARRLPAVQKLKNELDLHGDSSKIILNDGIFGGNLERFIDRALRIDGVQGVEMQMRRLRSNYLSGKQQEVQMGRAPEPAHQLIMRDDVAHRHLWKSLGSDDSRAYPTHRPVTYLQGRDDHQTPPSEAVRHFKSVPRAFAQIILIKNVGHLPLRPSRSWSVPDAITSIPKSALIDTYEGRDVSRNPDFECWRRLTSAVHVTKREPASVRGG